MSKVMKRLLLISLVLVLAFTFAACGGEDTPADVTQNEVDNSTAPVCEHQWMDADCDTAKTCRICKATEGTPLAHDWADADCTTPKTCKNCGATDGLANGHSTTAEGDRAATCTALAYCSVCEVEYGAALGHSTTAEGDRAATCTAPAYCSRCESEYGEANGHSTTAEGDRAATCTAPAYCSVCESEYGEANGHSTTAEDDRAATCTAPAYCSVCKQEYGAALGHSTTAEGDRAATCTTPAYCSVCQSEYGEAGGQHSTTAEGDRAADCENPAYCSVCQQEYGTALGHDMSEATCTEPSTCKNGCGKTEGDALGHDMSEATCTEPSTCKNGCGLTEGAALGHSVDADGDRAATCTAPAYCSRCESEYGEALGHSVGAEGDIAASCTNKAYCSRCESEYGEEATGHDMAPATCMLPSMCKNGCGYTEGSSLGHDFTGEVYKDDAGHWNVCLNGCGTINKVEHAFGDWEVSDTSKTHTCACGHSVTVQIIASAPEAAPEVTTPEQEASDLVLVSNSIAQYFLICKDSQYKKYMQGFADLLTQKTGVTFTYRETEPTNGKKIYIGYNPKNLMSDVDRLTYNGYVFRMNGDNIHITAYTAQSLTNAVTAFANLASNADYWTMNGNTLTITLPGSVIKTYNPASYANKDANLLGKHISNYVIVIPKSYSINERLNAEAMIDQIGKETGYKLEVIAANITNDNPYQIVMGQGTREYSATVYDGLAKGSYRIKSEGTSIYLAYDNYLVMSDACKALCELYKTEPTSTLDKVGYPDYSSEQIEKKDANAVRIMTTNIIAPGDPTAYEELEPNYGITWKNRIQIQGEMIMLYLPDFIGFQELQQGKVNGVTAAAHTEILKTIGDEYTMVYYDGLPKSEHWTPIAYRHNVWKYETGAQSIFDGAMHRLQWALFSKIDDPDVKYIVMNLHYPTSGNVAGRELAGKAVNEEFKRLKELYPDVPISITGDFNAALGSDLYNLTVAGTDLKIAYMATTDYGTSKAEIDHILIENDDVTVYNYRMVENGYIYMTSDHRPVVTDVSLQKIIIPTPGPDISWDDEEWITP